MGSLSWPRVTLIDPDPIRGRLRQLGLIKAGFPAVDIVHGVHEAGLTANGCPHQHLAMVVVIADADSAKAVAALRAVGYARILLISSARDVGLIGAIGAGAAGALITSGHPRLPAGASSPALSGSETAIVELIAQGQPNNAIAGWLGLSETAVKNHLIKISRKLHARDRAHIVALSLRSGFIN